MKVSSVNNFDNNINFKRTNKITKYGVNTLIAASSLFIISNAIDAFDFENNKNSISKNIDFSASMLGILGTFMSLVGIQEDEEDSNKKN